MTKCLQAENKRSIHMDFKKLIKEADGLRLLQRFGIQPLEGMTSFTEVPLPIDDEELARPKTRRRTNLPVADVGGKIGEDIHVFVELDNGDRFLTLF